MSLSVSALCQHQRSKNLPADSAAVATPSPTTRSRLTNGRDLFLGDVDGRSREARRYRDVYAALIAHLGGDGHASEVKCHLAKRASALIVWAEVEEGRLAAGEMLDVQTYTTAVNALRRLLGDLGLERAARDVTPPLADYLKAKAREVG